MSLTFSSFLTRFNASATVAMAALARQLKAQGKDIIDLSVGEPDFNTPPSIKQAGIQAIENNYSHYAPINGYLELRRAIVDKLKRDNQLFYHPENILVSTGAKQSIMNVVFSLVEAGDEVLIPAPYWNSYVDIVKMAGAKPVIIHTDINRKFKLSADDLEQAITPRTKLFIFSSPSNPCGVHYTEDELQEWVKVLEKHQQIAILSDEIYEHLSYNGAHTSIAQFTQLQNRTALVNGMSKGYAMTGWRIGYIAAPVSLVEQCSKIQGQITSGANSIAQMAATFALKNPCKEIETMRKAFLERRDFMVSQLKEIPGINIFAPEGAFYAFPDVSFFLGKQTPQGKVIADVNHLATYILEECGVASVAGLCFGAPSCLRFSFANSLDNIKKACMRLQEGLKKLS